MALDTVRNTIIKGTLALTVLTGCGSTEVKESTHDRPASSAKSEVALYQGDIRQEITRAMKVLYEHYRVLGEKKLKLTNVGYGSEADIKEEKVRRCLADMRGRILSVYEESEVVLIGLREELTKCVSGFDPEASAKCSVDMVMIAGKGSQYLKYTRDLTAALASGIQCLDKIPE